MEMIFMPSMKPIVSQVASARMLYLCPSLGSWISGSWAAAGVRTPVPMSPSAHCHNVQRDDKEIIALWMINMASGKHCFLTLWKSPESGQSQDWENFIKALVTMNMSRDQQQENIMLHCWLFPTCFVFFFDFIFTLFITLLLNLKYFQCRIPQSWNNRDCLHLLLSKLRFFFFWYFGSGVTGISRLKNWTVLKNYIGE